MISLIVRLYVEALLGMVIIGGILLAVALPLNAVRKLYEIAHRRASR